MTEHSSRRNSLTSMSTTASSQNNISVHDLSTDNLIAVDNKFVKKPTKKFPNSNGISPKLLSDASFRSPPMGGSSFYSKEGVYYFPNGEVFRPRTAPAKRNRPSKIHTDSPPTKPDNTFPSVDTTIPNHSFATDSPTHSPVHSSNSSSANSASTLPSNGGKTSIHSNNSLTSLPKSASLQNIKVLNKQNLVSNIRSNKGDIATNIVLEDSATKLPYESYRNSNSSSSLKNSHKLQSQNITKTEQYSNASSFSSQTSNVSNVSNLLVENADNSNSNVNRSATNTPSTSISDDHNRLSNEIRNSSGSSCDDNNNTHSDSATEDAALATLNEASEETFRTTPASTLRSVSVGHSNNSSWDNRNTLDSRRFIRDESGSSSSPSERNVPRSRNLQSSLSSPLTVGNNDSPNSTNDFSAGNTPSLLYDNISPLDVLKQRELSNRSGNSSPNSSYDSSNNSNNFPQLGAPVRPTLRDISRTSEMSSEEEVFKTPLSSPDQDSFKEPKETPKLAPPSPTSLKTATPIVTPPNKINALRPPRISAGSIVHFKRSNTDTSISTSTNSSSSGGTSNRKSQISLLPEPTIDTESFVEQYFHDSSPESYQLSEIISNLNSTPTQTHHQQQQEQLEKDQIEQEQKQYTQLINEKRQSLRSSSNGAPVKEQIIQVSEDQAIKFIPSPTDSVTTTPRSSRYYDINSSTFNKFLNDKQVDIPPRGDVMIVNNNKIRKHHRNASSTSSAGDFFNQQKKTSVNASGPSSDPEPATPKRSPIQEISTPQGKSESPPPPPPIEKSPGMRVKGRPKKKRSKKHGDKKSDNDAKDESHSISKHISKDSGETNGKKKEVEEFTIPIAIQTQPIKAPPPATNPNISDRPDASGHSTSYKSSENERDPSPSRSVLNDTTGTFEEELAKKSLKLKDMKNEEHFEDSATPDTKPSMPVRSLLLNEDADKSKTLGDNSTQSGSNLNEMPDKTLKKIKSLPSAAPDKSPVPDLLVPSSEKLPAHSRFEPSRKPPPIGNIEHDYSNTTVADESFDSNSPHLPPPPPPTVQPKQQFNKNPPKSHVYQSVGNSATEGNLPLHQQDTKKGGTNFKSFFKMFRPQIHEKSMDKSESTTSLSSTGSTGSRLFKFRRQKREEPDDLPVIAEKQKPQLGFNNDNRISVLSEIAPSIKLGSLPDFEPEETGLFEEMMLTFDEKFESELTPTSPPNFIHKITTGSSSLNEPFLRDDELSIAQIQDQQLKDDADGESGPSISSGDENDETENMDFIQSEARWATMDEGALNAYIDKSSEATLDAKTSKELERFRDQMFPIAAAAAATTTTATSTGDTSAGAVSNDARTAGASANTTSPVPITDYDEKVSTPVITATPLVAPSLVGSSRNMRMMADENFDPVVDGSETSSNRDGTKSMVIDSQELQYIFNNLTDDEKKNLPPHLKYIRQFKDYPKIEVDLKKFEDLSEVKLFVDRSITKRSILKRRKRMGMGGGGGFTATMKQTMIGGGISSGSSSNTKHVIFTNKISINETFASDMYKRYNKAVTQYSLSDPKEINKIKNELNYYKCNEMLVHESSQNNTHFFY
ncbi:conserved hypothetical protein [Candida dubliniensis CD36]|uniref:Uncharacterized protein n=1 Tax=Candida dubliniensis (strain CD36 / ATCC MYA-646 / CBS 7987 / NCPF 3949 / NRRL Y-17841) TaxID=573826 RepID=B9WCB5_CANDC|nr:conserved hypothetical protein [Candida dubliniensis CD36]CAX44037.1 conserved hypothetical protein [Candida dubliniensis CD36]